MCGSCKIPIGSPWIWVPTFLHLILVENRGAVLVPITTRSMLHEMTVRITMNDNNHAIRNLTCDTMHCEGQELSNSTLAAVYNDIKEGVTEYMRYPIWELISGKRFLSSNGLIEGNFGNLLPILLIIVHSWQVVFLVGLAVALFAARKNLAGKFDYRSGAYFTFVYRLQYNCMYDRMIRGLMYLSFILFLVFSVFVVLMESIDFAKRTVGSSFIQFIAWLYSVNSLRSEYIFTFNWRQEEFAELHFRRGFRYYIIRNAQYAEKLMSALVHAKRSLNPTEDPFLTRFLKPDRIEADFDLLVKKTEGTERDPQQHKFRGVVSDGSVSVALFRGGASDGSASADVEPTTDSYTGTYFAVPFCSADEPIVSEE